MFRCVLALMSAMAIISTTASDGNAQTGMRLAFDGAQLVFVPQMQGGRTGFTRFASVDAIGLEGAEGRMRLVLELALPPAAGRFDTPLKRD